jgi:hypothetical protein
MIEVGGGITIGAGITLGDEPAVVTVYYFTTEDGSFLITQNDFNLIAE